MEETKKKQFRKVVEDFVCENCGQEVKGDGYTNHCPKCLWSKHVDEVSPGDRASDCGGLMEPIHYEQKGNKWIITHKCQKCGKEIRQSMDEVPLVLLNHSR